MKRARGRPKKVLTAKQQERAEQKAAQPKRSRGRPKLPEHLKVQKPVKIPSGRGRGRPRHDENIKTGAAGRKRKQASDTKKPAAKKKSKRN